MTIFIAGTGPYICQTPYASGTGLTGSGYDAAWVSQAINITNTSNVVSLIPFTPYTDGWFHFEATYTSNTSGTRYLATLADNAGNARLRIIRSGGVLTPQRWDGATWQAVGEMPSAGGRKQFDIYFFRDDTNGEISFYYNKELVGQFIGDTTAITDIGNASFGNPTSFGSDTCQVSQVLAADFPTLFAKVKQTLLTVAGTHSEWTGSVADIDEASPSGSDFIYTDTADNRFTGKAAARDYTGFEVKALITMFDALRGGSSAPPNIRPMFRIGGVDYFGTPQALTFGKQNFIEQFANNPATALPWAIGEAGDANLEVGVQARA